MKKEYKYIGTILSIFALSITAILILLRKYSTLTFQHFVETCQQIFPTFFFSGVHFIGLALVVLTVLVAIVFCAKTLFSIVKTQRKISSLLRYKLDMIPYKLHKILKKLNLQKNRVVVVDRNTSHAFNYGLKSRRIVLSKGLIDRLSPNELEAVILHEQYHLENKHSLLLFLSEILSSTLFFIPITKEIHNRMKIVFERQADMFAETIQGNSKHLNAALLKVPSSRIHFYPGFSMRRQHKTSRKSIFVSIFTFLLAIALYTFPVSIHANVTTIDSSGNKCLQNQCSSHCPTDNMSEEPRMSYNLN